jgi:hypothetical protein
MDAQMAELTIGLEPQAEQNFSGLSAREVMNQILQMGYQTILLKGAFLDSFSSGIFLFVEEDVQFLLDEYCYVETLFSAQAPYEHGIYLNDGLLSFSAIADQSKVAIEFRYCPGLDVANLVTHHLTVPEEQYRYWWRNIAHQIFNLLSLAQDDRPREAGD